MAVAIRNNSKKDADAVTRKRFEEPAWNYPVARFVDDEGKDLIPRTEGDWRGAAPLLGRMVAALVAAERPVPPWLGLASAELNVERPETATIGMYCYWTGEKHLSGLDGVLATRIGTLEGREVIEVDFDAAVVPFRTILETARASCGDQVFLFARNGGQLSAAKALGVPARRTDLGASFEGTVQKHFLKRAPNLRLLPLTEGQLTKVNARVAAGRDVAPILTPTQARTASRLRAVLASDAEAFDGLEPDRSPKGIAAYAARLERALGEAEAKPTSGAPVR